MNAIAHALCISPEPSPLCTQLSVGIGDGDYGYDTSYGPAPAYSNLWVNDWLATFTDPGYAGRAGEGGVRLAGG